MKAAAIATVHESSGRARLSPVPPQRPPPARPTLDTLRVVLPAYGARFDRTLAAARSAIGPTCNPADPAHAMNLRTWLNKWLGRIRVPQAGEDDPFVSSLADWWMNAKGRLPLADQTLAHLTDTELGGIVDAYVDLAPRAAARSPQGRTRRFRPTATAKVLYFLRPNAVTAWDNAIARTVEIGEGEAFYRHLVRARSWAQALVDESAQRGIAESDIGLSIGRPESSVAKLIDEWLYQTVTRRAE
jgi:hypothetical protein